MKTTIQRIAISRMIIALGTAILTLIPSMSFATSLTLDEAIDIALNRTARGSMIDGQLEVAEQNYFARRINFYLPEISINGALPSYAVDESYRLFGGATRSALYKTRDLRFRSFIRLEQSLITGGDVTVTADLVEQDYRYPNTGSDANEIPTINQETRQGYFTFEYVQPLLKPSASKNTLNNTRDDFEIAKVSRIEDETELKKEVIEAYFGVLQTSLQTQINSDKLQSATLKAEIDSMKLIDGVISEEDWLLSASDRLDAELDHFEKETESGERERELAILLDWDVTEDVDLAEPTILAHFDENHKQQMLNGWESSAPIIKAEYEYSKSKRLADYAASGHGLSGDLRANYSTGQGRVDVDGFREDIDTKGWGVSLEFSYPIWDGGSSSAAVKAARLEAEQARLEYDRTKKNTRAEIVNLVNQLDVSYKRLEIMRQQVQLADDKLKIAESRYDDGQISMITLLESRVFYLEAKDRYLEELKTYILNRAEVEGKFVTVE